jgi:hypothetical protein
VKGRKKGFDWLSNKKEKNRKTRNGFDWFIFGIFLDWSPFFLIF